MGLLLQKGDGGPILPLRGKVTEAKVAMVVPEAAGAFPPMQKNIRPVTVAQMAQMGRRGPTPAQDTQREKGRAAQHAPLEIWPFMLVAGAAAEVGIPLPPILIPQLLVQGEPVEAAAGTTQKAARFLVLRILAEAAVVCVAIRQPEIPVPRQGQAPLVGPVLLLFAGVIQIKGRK